MARGAGALEFGDGKAGRDLAQPQDQEAAAQAGGRDFVSNHLHDLLRECGPTEAIRQRVFEGLLNGICTKPSGTERQKIIVFSPHPDDDVISMGGTLATLADQAHDVHIAYMTSGNIAVFDHDALRHLNYVSEFHELFELHSESSNNLCCRLRNAIVSKQPADFDTDEVLNVKTLIRKTEATAAAKAVGVLEEKLHFWTCPFIARARSRSGRSATTTWPSSPACYGRLRRARFTSPATSPTRTARTACAPGNLRALDVIRGEGVAGPEVWLYRGAWQEYEPHEIERAVPLSPETMLRKKLAIFKHESQKDKALFPGHDGRQFWVRAEKRTRNTAQIYNDLGLPGYDALEGFAQFSGQL